MQIPGRARGSKLFIYLQIKAFSVQQQTGSRAEPFKIAQSHKVIQKGREGPGHSTEAEPQRVGTTAQIRDF